MPTNLSKCCGAEVKYRTYRTQINKHWQQSSKLFCVSCGQPCEVVVQTVANTSFHLSKPNATTVEGLREEPCEELSPDEEIIFLQKELARLGAELIGNDAEIAKLKTENAKLINKVVDLVTERRELKVEIENLEAR